jgi:hypothetical protein
MLERFSGTRCQSTIAFLGFVNFSFSDSVLGKQKVELIIQRVVCSTIGLLVSSSLVSSSEVSRNRRQITTAKKTNATRQSNWDVFDEPLKSGLD